MAHIQRDFANAQRGKCDATTDKVSNHYEVCAVKAAPSRIRDDPLSAYRRMNARAV